MPNQKLGNKCILAGGYLRQLAGVNGAPLDKMGGGLYARMVSRSELRRALGDMLQNEVNRSTVKAQYATGNFVGMISELSMSVVFDGLHIKVGCSKFNKKDTSKIIQWIIC